MRPFYFMYFLTDVKCVVSELNSHKITKSEAKTELDILNEKRKSSLNEEEKYWYTVYTEYAKSIIDLRSDIPQYRYFVPHVDMWGRVYYEQEFIW